MTSRRRVALVLLAVGAAVSIAGSLLPWLQTGEARRNSYDIFRLVGRLGFTPDGPAATAIRWWPVMPLLATIAAVAAWWWPAVGGTIGVFASVYAGAVGVAVLGAPAAGVVVIGAGPAVTVSGAVVLLAGSVLAITSSTDRGARGPRGARPDGRS